MEDEEDVIEEEIPVYLSKNLTNLNVIQFPISNNRYDLDQDNIANCCFKPQSKQLKVDYKIATDSRNYDAFKGENLAMMADGNRGGPSTSKKSDKNDRPTFSSGRMDKITFMSSLGSEDTRYAVGMMVDKELHLVPVKTFFQLRQPYSLFDKGDKRTKAEKDDSVLEEMEEEVKAVTVKFAKSADSERVKKLKENSYYNINKKIAEEKWCEAMVYGNKTPQSECERAKFPFNTAHGDNQPFVPVSRDEYVKSLINQETHQLSDTTKEKTDDKEEKSMPLPTGTRGILSRRQISKLPLLDQLKTILRDAKVLSFNSIMDMVSTSEINPEKVLRNLVLCGTLVRGNWTLQSEILYPSTFKSPLNGISSELMIRARDYIIHKLIQSDLDAINRQRISIITQLPPEETKEILETVAQLKIKNDNLGSKSAVWELLKPPDIDFEMRHPEVCERQDALWKSLEEKFAEMELEKTEKRKRTRSVREVKIEK